MFNTPFGSNFQATPFGFPGFQGFQGFNPSWNQSFGNQFSPFTGPQGWNSGNDWNSSPWPSSNYWSNNSWNTPWNGNTPNFNGSQGFSPWNQQPNQWAPTPWNWFNSPFASQFGNQFAGQFGNQFGSPFGAQSPTPFGFNWWNAENPQSEVGAPGFGAGPFGSNPFAGFNPATQAA